MAEENTTKEKSLHSILHDQWVAAGKPEPSKTEGKRLLKAYQDAHAAKESAEKALVEAQAAETEAVSAIIRARGKGRLRINGEVHIPMSRGTTVYFRREGGGDVGELG